ncbi:uncharacterized protein HMPREF1541_06015 [Cyphellophora europaea CBS 101466]|uniref:HECT-type E3 ubiquitin transferase n=1 Tax=Cyphellophora europaea (strain CBS 101466) TaxID=1220924 RepID=W2RVQ8_CYPE1|nr:uncharacterized protein HMPREF1541_06015 [Cyphellophora europaea CBS 101466]ETN39789.1 hypothetical protein HMPREF1541_06015 [Cyphellophora europaea CBS 101466]
MRSPSSKHAVLHYHPEQSYDPAESFEEYQRLRVNALRSIPAAVARDIIQNEPQDSYRNIQVERDRRLRLITRRYENQIQYGCHNRHCATPTCLSYRRRNSKTPVRRYTETSARALACHLVEESTRNRKDPTLGLCPNQPIVPWYQDPRTTQERTATPAYTPSRASRTSANGQLRAQQEKRLSTTSHPVNGARRSSRQGSCSIPGDNSGLQNISSTQNSSVKDTAPSTKNDAPLSTPLSSANLGSSASPNVESDKMNNPEKENPQKTNRPHEQIFAHRVEQDCIKYLVVWRDNGKSKMAWTTAATIQNQSTLVNYKSSHGPEDALDEDQILALEASMEMMSFEMQKDQDEVNPRPEVRQNDSTKSRGDSKVDFASFAQSLWNTCTLRKLNTSIELKDDHPQAPEVPAQACPEVDDAGFGTIDAEAGSPWDENTHLHMNTAFRGFTLRRLSWDNLDWLVQNHGELGVPTNSPFETFIKQSIYYSFSNPNRLIESAKSWGYEGAPSESDGPESAPRSPTGVRLIQASLNSPTSQRPPRRRDSAATDRYLHDFDGPQTIAAFEIVELVANGTDVLFDALHDMIQQCYNVDHPAYDGEQAATLARKAFKGLGGGNYDISGKGSAAQADFIQQTGRLPDRKQISQIFVLVLMALATPLLKFRWSDRGFDEVRLLGVADVRNDNRASFTFGKFIDQEDRETAELLIEILDHLQDWHRQRLISTFTDCISHHTAAMEIRKIKSSYRVKPKNVMDDVLDLLCSDLQQLDIVSGHDVKYRFMLCLSAIDIARTVLLKDWDRTPIISRTGSVGGALELISALYNRLDIFELPDLEGLCEMPFIGNAFDEMEFPNEWLHFTPTARQTHILSYPFLFETSKLVKYFRAINVTAMKASFEMASMVFSDAYQFLQGSTIPVYGGREVLQSLRPYMAKYFVMTIRRSHVLEDAINQLWRRQKREILRPLRVRLGREEGEDGLDHGGVQQEFFRLAFAEAFNPDHGMFTVDDRTQMTWFQPGSVEPSWRFEAVGLLMGLAVYNGVTLPITMPLAFYRKLLGFKVKKLEHIQDGWPELAKGLDQLITYDGDVAEDIGRTYEFSYEFGGKVYTTDMSKTKGHRRSQYAPLPRPGWKGKQKAKSPTFELPPMLHLPPKPEASSASPSPSLDIDTGASSTSSSGPAVDTAVVSVSTPVSTPSPSSSPAALPLSQSCLVGAASSGSRSLASKDESPLVTNSSRHPYVKDYILHLTSDSVAPQYTAFTRGFHVCVSPAALQLFTPNQLRDVIEGERKIDIGDLMEHASYEDYNKDDHYVRAFWDVVKEEAAKDTRPSGDEERKDGFLEGLLEFILASSRVPVGGWGGNGGSGAHRGSFVLQRNGDVWVDAGVDNTSRDIPTTSGGQNSSTVHGERTVAGPAQVDGAADTGPKEKTYNARLPSSSTCYGRLLLPRYRVVGEDEEGIDGKRAGKLYKEVLRERLCKAIREGKGFGQL